MAVYTCISQEGTLSPEQRATLASEITHQHMIISGEPASFIHVIFETVSPDSTFVGGKPAPNAILLGIIREGRSTEVRARLLKELWAMYKKATGVEDDQLFVSVTEIPPSDSMVYGAILPDPGHEAEWLAQLGYHLEPSGAVVPNKYA
jgi:phenylpyruvate tautomerase PptA (4-oxalocrotonate tautomerase family)